MYEKSYISITQPNRNSNNDSHSHFLASRQKPVAGENCPHCGSTDCKAFVGYKNLQQLKKLKRQKRLTPCLELLENQGILGDSAIFVLGQVGGES
jgi:hypothetical protein